MQQHGRIAIDVHGIFYSQTENEELQPEIMVQDSIECEEEVDDLEDTKDLSNVQKISKQGFLKRQNKVTAETQLQNLSRLIKAKESTIKKLEIVDANKITTKLYKNKTNVCSKGCKKHQQPAVQKPTTERASKERQMSARGVHDRLYNMSKSQLLKEKYIPPLTEKAEPQRTLSASKSSKYLRNYIPFEKRLEEHLSLGQLANSYKKVSQQDQFKPRLIPNKYTDRVQARYNKHEIRQLRPSDIAQFLNSSVSSSLSSQSRSAAIINRIEEHFIAKVKLIFMENTEEVIQVNEETIGLLTEVEFNILQPFIMEIEEKGIRAADFQTKFREFYDSLRLGDRLQLRNHETKTRGKYREMRQQTRQKLKSPKKPEQKIEPKSTKPFKKEQAKGDYHLAIQQFI